MKKQQNKHNNSISGRSQSLPESYSATSDGLEALAIPTEEPTHSLNVSTQLIEQHSGPVPSPRILKGYMELIPDAPERILKMAEMELAHSMEMDKSNISLAEKDMNYGYKAARRGQWMGYTLAITAIGCGVALTILGFESAGITLFGITAAGVVAPFLGYLYKKKKKGTD